MKNNFIICGKCDFKNPGGSIYCQHCGEKLRVKRIFFKKDKSNVFLAGSGTKGSSLAPLAGMSIQNRAAEFCANPKKVFPAIQITPSTEGIWFCPLCGDKNTKTDFCKGCGFDNNNLG